MNANNKVSQKKIEEDLGVLLEELYLKRSPFNKSQRHDNLFQYIQSKYSKISANKVIVIGGTNGKGSVAKALEALFLSHRMTTGLFTSPHLVRLNERIKINGISISDEELRDEILFLKKDENFKSLGFFEVLTLIACRLFFKIHCVDIVILEVGLGGTHDPVNAVPHHWAAITQVALDHTELLGKDLDSIARHKFGIASKSGVLFLGSHELLKFQESMEKVPLGCKIMVHPEPEINETHLLEQSRNNLLPTYGFRERDSTIFYESRFMNTYYAVQNLSYALFIFREVAIHFKTSINSNAIDKCFKNLLWPGRLHRALLIGENVYLSGDHNPNGIAALRRSIEEHKAKKIIFLLGRNPLKEIDDMKSLLEGIKSAEVEMIPDQLFSGKSNEVLPQELKTFIEARILKLGREDVLVITGSLYLIGGIYKMYGYNF